MRYPRELLDRIQSALARIPSHLRRREDQIEIAIDLTRAWDAEQEQARLGEVEQMLGNLIARLDGDGGHAQMGKPLRESFERADARIVALQVAARPGPFDALARANRTGFVLAIDLLRDEKYSAAAKDQPAREDAMAQAIAVLERFL